MKILWEIQYRRSGRRRSKEESNFERRAFNGIIEITKG